MCIFLFAPGARACLGDFSAERIKDPEDGLHMVERCSSMPLADGTEWTIMGASITIPSDLATNLCQSPANTFDFCIAFSICDHILPSIAFAVSGTVIGCAIAQVSFSIMLNEYPPTASQNI